MGVMVPPSRKSCYNFRVTKINRVVDGDTIDVTIDLGFDLYKKERVRIAGVDTPEKRTRDLEEKALGIDATNWLKDKQRIAEYDKNKQEDVALLNALTGAYQQCEQFLQELDNEEPEMASDDGNDEE